MYLSCAHTYDCALPHLQGIWSKAPIMAFSGTQQKCKACDKTVYVIDQLTADGVVYHQACFRCSHCKRTLTVCFILPPMRKCFDSSTTTEILLLGASHVKHVVLCSWVIIHHSKECRTASLILSSFSKWQGASRRASNLVSGFYFNLALQCATIILLLYIHGTCVCLCVRALMLDATRPKEGELVCFLTCLNFSYCCLSAQTLLAYWNSCWNFRSKELLARQGLSNSQAHKRSVFRAARRYTHWRRWELSSVCV